MEKYSIKMRASQNIRGRNLHISGAEKIVSKEQVKTYAEALVERGLNHSKGNADLLNIKIEKINEEDILYLNAPSVTTTRTESVEEGREEIIKFLKDLHIERIDEVMHFLDETYAMRGAMLLDIRTMKRMEPDYMRGIRATYMDKERDTVGIIHNNDEKKDGNHDEEKKCYEKNHYEEAVVLATKVMNCPGMIGEICISDDPDYVTGYVASKIHGYRRITKIKEQGSDKGGRIFLFDSEVATVEEAIEFLQEKRVIVRGIKELEKKRTECQNKKTNKWDRLEKKVQEFHEKNIYRTMKKITSAQGSHITVDGRELVLMASNSYLDLTAHPYIKQRCHEIVDRYGFGSGGSRLTTGNTDLHEKLEEKIAEFKGCESSIVFNTGYVANLAVISAMTEPDDIIFSDELNHASIIDGCRLSKAKCIIYQHNDMNDLEMKIRENPCKNGLVVSDAVFSMDGDILNLPEFIRICKEHNLFSMVDEAHSTGVIGETGHGIVEYFGNIYKPDILMGTLSKSIGGEGGYVAGTRILIDYLRNTARGFIFSTSLSPVTIAADLAGIELIEKEPQRIEKLRNNIRFFCNCLAENGIMVKSDAAIIPIIVGDEKKAMELSEYLYDNGFYISAIRYPTVKKGEARLRVALMSGHTQAELEKVAKLIGKYYTNL